MYAEQFENLVVDRFSTNANHNTIVTDIVTIIRDAIIATLEVISQADCTTIEPTSNSLVLSCVHSKPLRLFLFCTPDQFRTVFGAVVVFNTPTVCIKLSTVSVFADCDTFSTMDLFRMFIMASIQHINAGAVGAEASAGAGP